MTETLRMCTFIEQDNYTFALISIDCGTSCPLEAFNVINAVYNITMTPGYWLRRPPSLAEYWSKTCKAKTEGWPAVCFVLKSALMLTVHEQIIFFSSWLGRFNGAYCIYLALWLLRLNGFMYLVTHQLLIREKITEALEF